MKKIGVITTSCVESGSYGSNYGAALQGYALIQQLRLMGFDAYDINYNSSNEHRPDQYSLFKRTIIRIGLLTKPDVVKNKISSIRNRKNNQKLFNAFMRFVREYNLTYENGKYFTLEELKSISGSFFAFITGSDVVWNPYLHKEVNDKGYFLDFTTSEVKRIAYAPSTGVTIFPESAQVDLKDLLIKFDALSIREESGANLIKEITGLNVPVVLDPTMLLNPTEYSKIEKMPSGFPPEYILVYKFGNIPHTMETIRRAEKYFKLPVVYIPAGKYEKGITPSYDIGPAEFIGLIKNARVVITDSFHCSVFCLIYHTPFYTFFRTLPQKGKELNSRMKDLLSMVELQDRLIKPEKKVDFTFVDEINFDAVDTILAQRRKESLNYLKKALEMD